MVHRSKEEIISHDRVKQNLKHHGVPNLLVNEVADSTLSILWKEKIFVCPMHFDHGNEKGGVTNDIVHKDTENQDTCTIERIDEINLFFTVQDPCKRCNRKDQKICSTTCVREHVGGKKDLVVAWDIRSQKGLEERSKHSLTKPIANLIEHELMCCTETTC